MQILRHWAKASLPCEAEGRTFPVVCWRGSPTSRADAETRAREAVRRAVDALRSGRQAEHYDYDQRELREEILEEHADPHGQVRAVLSRNRYGAVILNAEELFFADLDLEPPRLWDRLLHLFGRPLPDREAAAMATLSEFCRANPQWHFRVYRTFNGLRLMAPHAPQDPESASTQAIQKQLGSDRLFVRLCRCQKSFRARLSPKPWRIGIPRPEPFPREDAGTEARFRAWLTGYQLASEPHATCRFLKALGSGCIDPRFRELVRLHDDWTRASTLLPLA